MKKIKFITQLCVAVFLVQSVNAQIRRGGSGELIKKPIPQNGGIVLKDENTYCKGKQMGTDQIILLISFLIFKENYFTVVNFKRNCPGFVDVIG